MSFLANPILAFEPHGEGIFIYSPLDQQLSPFLLRSSVTTFDHGFPGPIYLHSLADRIIPEFSPHFAS